MEVFWEHSKMYLLGISSYGDTVALLTATDLSQAKIHKEQLALSLKSAKQYFKTHTILLQCNALHCHKLKYVSHIARTLAFSYIS